MMYTEINKIADSNEQNKGYTHIYTTKEIHIFTQQRIYADVHKITDTIVPNKGYTQIYTLRRYTDIHNK